MTGQELAQSLSVLNRKPAETRYKPRCLVKEFRLTHRHTLRRSRRVQLGFERLENRALLAIDVTLSGTQVAFIDDGSEVYPLSLSVNELGQLQYNLRTIVDGALVSEINSIDLDTGRAWRADVVGRRCHAHRHRSDG